MSGWACAFLDRMEFGEAEVLPEVFPDNFASSVLFWILRSRYGRRSKSSGGAVGPQQCHLRKDVVSKDQLLASKIHCDADSNEKTEAPFSCRVSDVLRDIRSPSRLRPA